MKDLIPLHKKVKLDLFVFSPDEAAVDPGIRCLVVEQTKQWTELMEKHRKEEWDMLKAHLQAQEDTLKKLMEGVHANQLKQLEAKHERYEWSRNSIYFLRYPSLNFLEFTLNLAGKVKKWEQSRQNSL